MELTYKIRGADGKEYGPTTLVQINRWLSEGRINAQTEIMRSDIDYWAPLGGFTEFQSGVAAAPARAMPQATAPLRQAMRTDPAAEAHVRSGASWFYWIAGLSLVNAIIALTGSQMYFVIGLGITQIFSVAGAEFHSTGKIIAFVLGLIATAIFILFGVFSHKRHTWAFVVGMILYAIDGLIVLLFQEWLAVAFHVYALVRIFQGFNACRALKSA